MSATFAGYQPYGNYQVPYPPYTAPPGQAMPAAAAVHYMPQFPQPPPATGYPILYGLPPAKPPSPAPAAPVAPEFPGMSSEIASKEIQKLIVRELKRKEFEAIEAPALRILELEVVAFIQVLYERAHEYANLANRAIPIAKDLLLACGERSLRGKDLHTVAVDSKSSACDMESLFEPPLPREPSPELLPSDDESTPPLVPTTLRTLPPSFPPLPPKHTYLKTPASPPKKAALPSLERKLKNAGLVQESLKNLLTVTEDNLGQEDGELLGHIVNWEASTYPRKRWKVTA